MNLEHGVELESEEVLQGMMGTHQKDNEACLRELMSNHSNR